MSEATLAGPRPRPGPGRPSTGARDRILDAGLEVLKRDGFAGLTTAKVAAASGHNKALIAYHFGGKDGLVAEVALRVAEAITAEVLAATAEADCVEGLVRGVTDGVWRVIEADEGIQRVYFDLASQSVVDPEVRRIMREMKEGFRAILREQLAALPDGPPADRIEAWAVHMIAGVEGLALERLGRGETPELTAAREIFVAATARALAA